MDVLWVAFEGPQRGRAYQPRVQPWEERFPGFGVLEKRRIFRNNQTARGGYAAFLQNAPIRCGAYPGFYPGLVCRAPLGLSTRRTHRFVAGRTQGSTLAGMLRPVGAFNTQNAPIRCGLEGVYEVPICRCGKTLASGYNRNG